MEHGFFHPNRGYWQTISTPSNEMLATHPEGTLEIPLRPSALHTWNGFAWIPPTQTELDAITTVQIRAQRNALLTLEVDPMVSNPLRWGDLTSRQQQAWVDYRHALLDIPQQAGFPANVTWPIKPE